MKFLGNYLITVQWAELTDDHWSFHSEITKLCEIPVNSKKDFFFPHSFFSTENHCNFWQQNEATPYSQANIYRCAPGINHEHSHQHTSHRSHQHSHQHCRHHSHQHSNGTLFMTCQKTKKCVYSALTAVLAWVCVWKTVSMTVLILWCVPWRLCWCG